MTKDEKRAMNMAIWLVFQFGFRAGMAFQEKHGDHAEKALSGRIFEEKDTGQSYFYIRPFSDNDYNTLPELFQWIKDAAIGHIENFGDDDTMPLVHTGDDLHDHPYVKKFLAGKRLSVE